MYIFPINQHCFKHFCIYLTLCIKYFIRLLVKIVNYVLFALFKI